MLATLFGILYSLFVQSFVPFFVTGKILQAEYVLPSAGRQPRPPPAVLLAMLPETFPLSPWQSQARSLRMRRPQNWRLQWQAKLQGLLPSSMCDEVVVIDDSNSGFCLLIPNTTRGSNSHTFHISGNYHADHKPMSCGWHSPTLCTPSRKHDFVSTSHHLWSAYSRCLYDHLRPGAFAEASWVRALHFWPGFCSILKLHSTSESKCPTAAKTSKRFGTISGRGVRDL
jgi:hypothetical protein